MNGDQLLVLMKNSPAMMTSRTMPTLTATITKLTSADSLIPRQITTVRIKTMAAAIRLCWIPDASGSTW